MNDETVHCEKAKGSPDQNIAYCTKQESRATEGFFEFTGGKPSVHGGRSDVTDFVNYVRTGATDYNILDTYPQQFVKFGKSISGIRMAIASARTTKPIVSVYWGPTGTGTNLRRLSGLT